MLKNNTSLLIVYHYDIYFNSEGDVCIYRGIKEICPYIFRNNFFLVKFCFVGERVGLAAQASE